MRLVFMGTPAFAVPALEALIEAGHEIAAVYTQPPRPAGRGHKLQESAVHVYAKERGLEVRTPLNFKDEAERQKLRDLKTDIGVVAGYGVILPRAILDAPQHGYLNIHYSLLPRWRGAAPFHRPILAGDAETGVTIMRIEAGIDTGPMLLAGTAPIGPADTVQDLYDRLGVMGAGLMVKVLNDLPAYPERAQTEEGATYAHKIDKSEGDLKGTESAIHIDRMVRAFNPWPGVWLHKNNQRFKLLEAEITAHKNDAVFGCFLNRDGDMADGQGGAIRIKRLQAPNGKIMDVASAVNGGLLCVGS